MPHGGIEPETAELEVNFLTARPHAVTSRTNLKNETEVSIRNAQTQTDDTLTMLYLAIQKGWLETIQEVHQCLRHEMELTSLSL